MKKMGWEVEISQSRGLKNYIYIKKLPLVPFSVAKILRCHLPENKEGLKRFLKQIHQADKKHRTLFIKLYPFLLKNQKNPHYSLLITHYSKDKSPLIPTKTIWINLKKTEKELLKEIKKKVRYSINFSKKRGVKTKIVSGDKITNKQSNEFYKIWSKNKPHNWLFKPNFNELKYLVESFGKKCFFVFALTNHQPQTTNHPISGVLILTSKNMAFDWFGANTLKGRKLLAKSLILWKAIKESKKRGLKIFDFEGIYDKRFPKLNKGWIGFSNFKKGFGGREIEFCQPLIKLLPDWA